MESRRYLNVPPAVVLLDLVVAPALGPSIAPTGFMEYNTIKRTEGRGAERPIPLDENGPQRFDFNDKPTPVTGQWRHRSAPCHGHVGAAVLAEEDLLEPVFLNGGQVLGRLRSRNRPEVYKQDLRTVGREVFQKPREPMPRTCETLCRIHSCIRAAGKTCPTTSRPRRKLIPPQNLR
jgi:hypothetical protein